LAEEISGSPLEIKEIAERALWLQRYLLRKAWGVLYAAWSLPIFLTVFNVPGVVFPGLSVERIAVGMFFSGAALTITLRTFKRVRDTAQIRSLVFEGKWRRALGYRVLVPTWVAIYAILILLIFVFRIQAGLVVPAVYVSFWAYLYYALRLSFPGKLPTESIAAISSFGIAIAGSIVMDLSFLITSVYILLWGVALAIWVSSALYARTRAPPGSLERPAV
jgi:hypothetical protein